MNPIALCIDTISKHAGITLIKEDKGFYLSLEPKNASETIIETIDHVLQKTELSLSDLTAIVVMKGPGSFTGLRVGISVANQLAHQLKLPIKGVTTNEWFLVNQDHETIYVQSMNRAEFYVSDGSNTKIITIDMLSEFGGKKWVGELKFDHADKIPQPLHNINESLSIGGNWKTVADSIQWENNSTQKYELVEPFYGKEPNITTSKKKLSPFLQEPHTN